MLSEINIENKGRRTPYPLTDGEFRKFQRSQFIHSAVDFLPGIGRRIKANPGRILGAAAGIGTVVGPTIIDYLSAHVEAAPQNDLKARAEADFLIAGRGFRISEPTPGSIKTEWQPGTNQSLRYNLVKKGGFNLFTLPRGIDNTWLPVAPNLLPSQTTFIDTPAATTLLTCYSLVATENGTPIANSEVLCSSVNNKTGVAPEDFTLQYDQSRSSLNWRTSGSPTDYLLYAIKTNGQGTYQVLSGSATTASVETNSSTTCIYLTSRQNGQNLGTTGVLCDVANSSNFDSIPIPTNTPTVVPTRASTETPTQTPTKTSSLTPSRTPAAAPSETVQPQPSVNPSATANTTESVGGRNFKLADFVDGSGQNTTRLSWRQGSNQTLRYTLSKTTGGQTVVLPVNSSFPPETTTYSDSELTPGTSSCYQLNVLENNINIAKSDTPCRVFGRASGTAASGFTIELDQSSIAKMSWEKQGNPGSYLVLAMKPRTTEFVMLSGTDTFATFNTRGETTCFILYSIQAGLTLGQTDIYCATPNTYLFPVEATPTASPTRPATPTPTRFASPTTTSTAIELPTSTPTPQAENCAPWPQDATVTNELAKLPIPPGVCLVMTAGAMSYHWDTRQIWADGSRPSFIDDLRHELGHAHQQYTLINDPDFDYGIIGRGRVHDWIDTQEGIDFIQAYDAYESYQTSIGALPLAYPRQLGYFENLPNLISDWYRPVGDPKDPQNLPYLGEFVSRFPR